MTISFLSGLFVADVQYNRVVEIVDRLRARDSGWPCKIRERRQLACR